MATSLKISKRSSSKRTIMLAIAGALLLSLSAAGVYFYLQRQTTPESTPSSDIKPRNTVDYGPAKPEDKIGESSKDAVVNGNDQQPTPSAQDPLTVTISNTSQDGESPFTVHVRAFTPSATTGTCTLTLSKGSGKVVKTADLSTQAGYTICQGFDIARNEFSEAGVWKVLVEIVSASGSRGSAEATVEIK